MVSNNIKVQDTEIEFVEVDVIDLRISTIYLPYLRRYITQVFEIDKKRIPIEESTTDNYQDAMNNHWDLVEQHSQNIEK